MIWSQLQTKSNHKVHLGHAGWILCSGKKTPAFAGDPCPKLVVFASPQTTERPNRIKFSLCIIDNIAMALWMVLSKTDKKN